MSPQPQNDRQGKVEALKREQKAAERRTKLPLIAGIVVVGAVLIAVPTVKMLSNDSPEPAPAAQRPANAGPASCGEVLVDPSSGVNDHVTGKAEYPTSPPSSGKHFAAPVAVNERGFYTPRDAPRLEELVHNLEHGYTIVWYLPTLDTASVDELKALAGELRNTPETRKFIAAPWDEDRGRLPAGQTVAISHWGASQGYRQYCDGFSGDAVEKFLDAHPTSDSPEPTMA